MPERQWAQVVALSADRPAALAAECERRVAGLRRWYQVRIDKAELVSRAIRREWQQAQAIGRDVRRAGEASELGGPRRRRDD